MIQEKSVQACYKCQQQIDILRQNVGISLSGKVCIDCINNGKNYDMIEMNEVEKAKEELKEDLQAWFDDVFGDFVPLEKIRGLEPKPVYETFLKAQNLINALDNIKTEPVVDNKIEGAAHFVDANKKEGGLPWKNVSELPENSEAIVLKNKPNKDAKERDVFAKYHYLGQEFREISFVDDIPLSFGWGTIVKYITLTDLINSIESMLSRQNELEERIKKLEVK